jgi:hypothetical protein
MSKETAIKQEVLKLSIQIASLRYDFEQARIQGLSYSFTSLIARELCDKERIKKALELGNFKDLPYNVKLLFK